MKRWRGFDILAFTNSFVHANMTQGRDILNLWFLITASTAGVVIGTLTGAPILKRVPETIFAELLLGGVMLFSITQ